MQRLHLPKCPLSSNKELEVSRRNPVSLRLDVSYPSGRFHHNGAIAINDDEDGIEREQSDLVLTGIFSDGIARVHGMSNVQAEELVE